MASYNIVGLIPVYVPGATSGEFVLQYVRADTVFFNIVPAPMTTVPTAPPMEEHAEPIDKEVEEAGDAFFAQLEEDEMDKAAREWEAEDHAQEEEELAHVVELLEEKPKEELPRAAEPFEDMKEELHKLFRELYKLSETQKPLYKEVMAMEAEQDQTVREKNKTKYWDTWNRMVSVQKDWLGTLDAFRALDTKLSILDPGYKFNTLANKMWYPDGPERDYWTLYATIERSFKGNISRDEKRRARKHAPSVGKPAPASRTLGDLIGHHVGGDQPA